MTDAPHIVVLVNGPAQSAAAERARHLFEPSEAVAEAGAAVLLRERGKVRETLRFFRALIARRPALVYVVDMAFSGVLAGAAYRLVRPKSRLVIDTGDAIHALAKKTGRGRVGLAMTAALERLGQWAADRLVVRGSAHRPLLGRHAGKAVVIPDGVTVADYAAVPPLDASSVFTEAAPLVVGVIGSLHWNAALGWCYGMELIEALRHLDGLPVRGVIVGDGDGLPHLKRCAAEQGLAGRVEFVDRVPPDALPAVLASMHVALSTQTDDAVGRVRTTGKLPLYLAAGRYVLASRVGEARRLLPDEMLIDYHGAFDPSYPSRLAAAIERLVRHRNLLALARHGPEIARQLEYSNLSKRLDATLRPLLPASRDADPERRRPVLYLALGVHCRGGMERAAYETINRLSRERPVVIVARESDCQGTPHERVWAPRRPAIIEVTWYKWRARRVARKYAGCITTGIGASGGPVDVVVAQYCQEAFRRRVGTIRANGPLQAWWHRRNLARFCAEERAVYQSPRLKRVIAVSHGVGREIIESYGVDERIVRYVPNGVDLSVFRPADAAEKRDLRDRLGLPADGLLACFVGGDWRRKGLRAAIESLRDVRDAHLVIAGAGNQDEFAAHTTAAGVQDRVHFVGKRPDPEAFLRASDAYVFPSAYEAFSLSCIEAAACGLPLVVTRINGTDELVRDGENGFFVEPIADSIAVALRRLRDDGALRGRMSARAAADARRYDWDVIAAGHERVYAELDGGGEYGPLDAERRPVFPSPGMAGRG